MKEGDASPAAVKLVSAAGCCSESMALCPCGRTIRYVNRVVTLVVVHYFEGPLFRGVSIPTVYCDLFSV